MRPIAELPPAGFDVLWDDLGLGALPFPLEIACHGDTLDERARIKVAVYNELNRRRLIRSGRPIPELDDSLRLLATRETAITLVVMHETTGPSRTKALVAARGKQAVLAVQRRHAIHLTEVRDTAIIESVVDLLPESRPGPGRSMTLPAATPTVERHSRAEHGSFLRPMTNRAPDRVELAQIAAVMERPVHRAGLLGVTLRDTRGKLQRLPGVIWLDNDQGRYALSVKRGADGADWTTLSPIDNSRLATRLGEILATARHNSVG
ncbi:ESX secretion-associated protein EspG [Actinokineospora sp.]|uniref:ESX secretion-associated protein EspG n=1 Tax=Actinokineospora sp. TaxID=1872133 RepID=UPI0040379934